MQIVGFGDGAGEIVGAFVYRPLLSGDAEGFAEGDATGNWVGLTDTVGLDVGGCPFIPPPQAQLNGVDYDEITGDE